MACYVSDLESDGLLDTVSKFHCAVAIDVETEEVHWFGPKQAKEYLQLLEGADSVIFHNGIGYDYPALCKLFPEFSLPKERVVDTLVLSRLTYPGLKDIDFLKSRQEGSSYKLPGKLIGSHSLAAWGYRLHDYKGDFKPENYTNAVTGEPHTWATIPYSQDMHDYCEQDCWVTLRLLRRIRAKGGSEQAAQLEHDIAWLMAQQERNGWRVDKQALIDLYGNLSGRREELRALLTDTFGSWYAPDGEVRPKRTLNYKVPERADLTQGAVYTKLKHVTFNPASRDHIARCLLKRYGWQPKVLTNGGKPKIDETVLEHLPYAECEQLNEYFIVNKLIGTVAEGPNAWLRLMTADGYLHHYVNPNGAGTGRATHSNPNLAQVPGNGKPFGRECRSAFIVPDGWCLLGTDAAGLELRCLAEELSPYDGGAYIDTVLNGDVHWTNTLAFGLLPAGTVRDKHDPHHDAMRNLSKTLTYAL